MSKIEQVVEYCKKCIEGTNEVISALQADSKRAYERYLEDKKFFGEADKGEYLYLQDCIRVEKVRKSVYEDILKFIEEMEA